MTYLAMLSVDTVAILHMIVCNRQNNISPKLYDHYWRKLFRDQVTTVKSK